MERIKKIMLSKNTFIALSVMALFAIITTFAYAGDFEKEEVYIYKDFSEGAYLGVSIDRIPLIEKKKLDVKFGVIVKTVKKKSAAEKGGIKEGDVIQFFNEIKIRVPNDLIKAVRKNKAGAKAIVKLVRNKKNKTIKVVLSDYAKQFKYKKFKSKRAYLGVNMEDMNSDFGEYFGVKNGEGALIKKVIADTPAEEAELKSGDVIIKIGKMQIKSARDVSKALSKYKKNDKVKIEFLRHKKKKTVKVELDERSIGGFNFQFDKLRHLKGLRELRGLKELKHFKHLEDLNIDIHKLQEGFHNFEDFDVHIDCDGNKKKIMIKKKLKEIKEKKKKLKKVIKEKKQEKL